MGRQSNARPDPWLLYTQRCVMKASQAVSPAANARLSGLQVCERQRRLAESPVYRARTGAVNAPLHRRPLQFPSLHAPVLAVRGAVVPRTIKVTAGGRLPTPKPDPRHQLHGI